MRRGLIRHTASATGDRNYSERYEAEQCSDHYGPKILILLLHVDALLAL